ncbi:tyrosine phosphatase type IVA 1-like protein [Euroglyphus maynei]|uniref:Tyrosine phosphatase type IVA 1-like protein n=1 Tax=Euroglyphus maynei TaxID=6958 RepID=A0A1Y3BK70_EURMA|nr:tyrosine phosphatase type IVA 1-like protein [Euroglyphus maynei]
MPLISLSTFDGGDAISIEFKKRASTQSPSSPLSLFGHHSHNKSYKKSSIHGHNPNQLVQPKFTEIRNRNLRFLITDKPTDATLNQYVEELQRRNVTDVVRVCEATYSPKRLEQAGIKCHDWAFDDGTPPPQKIIDQWLELIIERFKDCPIPPTSRADRKVSSAQINGSNSVQGSPGSTAAENIDNKLPCIAVHCVAGLGRAPVLVAIALIEAGLKYIDAVEMIRAARRGAINAKQLDYLSEYKPKKVLMFSNRSSSKRKYCCVI